MSIGRLLQWSAARNATRTAFVYQGESRTFAQVDERARRLANSLLWLKVRKGDRVVVLCGNRPEYFEAEMAIGKIGAVRVPALANLPAPEIRRLIRLTEPVAVIASEESADAVREALASPRLGIHLITTGGCQPGELSVGDLIAEGSDVSPDVQISDSDLYAIRFTGGTTGDPKGVLMDHAGMSSALVNLLLALPTTASDVGLHVTPLSHAAGFWAYMYWLRGAASVIFPAFHFEPHQVLRAIEAHGVTSVYLVPTTIYRLLDALDDTDADISTLQTIYYGAAPISPARLTQALRRIGASFVQTYGMSEAPAIVTTLDPGDHLDAHHSRLGSVGRPVLNVEVVIRDLAGRPVAAGETGEVTVRSGSAMRGYWQNQKLTAERIRDGWVHTGDVGRFDQDGYLFLVDRKEDMIITGGFNVFPTEVEQCLYQHPGVRETVVFGVPDEAWGESVTAIIVPHEEAGLTEADIRLHLSTRLAKYKVPKILVIRSRELPKSSVGKVLRRTARTEFQDGDL
jgi:fatty-acyl-CoA synthase/long-chain acyl-CoA synthetase